MPAKKSATLVDVAEIGRKGGRARAKNVTKQQRSEAARKAVQARWDAVKQMADKRVKGSA